MESVIKIIAEETKKIFYYTCKLCGEKMAGKEQKLHDVLDEWVLGTILIDHPDWKQIDGACPRCIAELKKKYKEADEIEWIHR